VNLNRKQLIVLWMAIGIIAIMCLFPPWQFQLNIPGRLFASVDGPYRFLVLGGPKVPKKVLAKGASEFWSAKIDLVRLLIPCSISVMIAVALIITLAGRKKP
jgi:hypothetical protein